MANGKKGKVKWIQGDQTRGVSVSTPTTRRLARRGIQGRKHRQPKGR